MKRALQNLFRLLATGLVVFGAMGFGLEFMRHRLHDVQIRWPHCVGGALLLGLGGLLFWASGRLAERFADDSDDDSP